MARRYVMTAARKAALRKAQIASARKRSKGIRKKVKTYARTHRAKQQASKVLWKNAVKRQAQWDREARFARRAGRAKARANYLEDRAHRARSKANKAQRNYRKVKAGAPPMTFSQKWDAAKRSRQRNRAFNRRNMMKANGTRSGVSVAKMGD